MRRPADSLGQGSHRMIFTIIGALLPIVVTLLLGFAAAQQVVVERSRRLPNRNLVAEADVDRRAS